MQLKIIRVFEDVTRDEDSSIVLLEIDGNVVMHGDYYHDKIESKIDGFKECLKFLNTPCTIEIDERSVVDEDLYYQYA